MAVRNTAVYGIFPDRRAVEGAIDMLRAAGFRSTDISVLIPEGRAMKGPERLAPGVPPGDPAGEVLGWLTGIGVLAPPGIGPFVVAGPIAVALAGVGGPDAPGKIARALVGIGIPENGAKRIEERIRSGAVLLSVYCDSTDWVKRAKEVFAHTAAQDSGASGETVGRSAGEDRPMPRVRRAAGTRTNPDPDEEE